MIREENAANKKRIAHKKLTQKKMSTEIENL